MLITKIVTIKWNQRNKEHFESKGYIYTKKGDEFEVKVEDLSDGYPVYINAKCDCEDCKNPYLPPMKWCNYLRYVKEDNKYFCNDCAKKLFGKEKELRTRLKNSKSFYDWCIEHNRQDILARWDYELNGYSPKEVLFSSMGIEGKGFWFKCQKELHPSELKNINSFTNGSDGTMDCKACNSIAQWGIDKYGKNFLRDYWDYEKNNALGIDPWKIAKGNDIVKVWIFCQIHKYHGSYDIRCSDFSNNIRCSYCSGRKVHLYDSLGYLYPEVIPIWSEKNKLTPYDYMPNSNEEICWKCLENKHDDYKRSVKDSNVCEFRCPECQYSKGEKKIEEWLTLSNFIKDIDYIPQKEFDGLLGIGGRNLSYDFYLPNYNLLIEYQGEYHDGTANNQTEEKFKTQQEHDRRKKEYANKNNIKLLPIWYWDYNNIEKILDKELNCCEVSYDK